jgi:hypothetical protein
VKPELIPHVFNLTVWDMQAFFVIEPICHDNSNTDYTAGENLGTPATSDDDASSSSSYNESDFGSAELAHMHIPQFVVDKKLSDVAVTNLLNLLKNKHVRGYRR